MSGPSASALTIDNDLPTYVGFGSKEAGGPGDTAAGAWIEERLGRLGFTLERQAVPGIAIDEADAALIVGEHRAAVATHFAGPSGVFGQISGPVRVWGAPPAMRDSEVSNSAGAIIVAHLPRQRWSSAEQPLVRQIMERAFSESAAALVLVTHGPTRELIKLNRPLRPSASGPIALLAPREWPALEAAMSHRADATLQLNASERRRDAFNVIGRIDRGAPSDIVISTPRSGWTAGAGERGPGVAAFLALAAWTPRAFPRHNLVFACTSVHEFENEGAAAFLESAAPPPERTALWLHLGAGFAARDWHEAGSVLEPLPSPDPQRFLVVSPKHLDASRRAFAGLAGLEAPYSTSRGAAGELSNIVAAGYPSVIGLFGAHRFHHVAGDDMRCVDPAHAIEVFQRIAQAMRSILARG